MVRKVFLTGGGSLLRSIGKYLSTELQVEVQHLHALNAFELNNIATTDDNNAKTTRALSLALGAVGRRLSDQVDFRKAEFTKDQSGLMGKEMKYLFKISAIVVLILFVNIIGNTVILKASKKNIDVQMLETAKKFPVKVPESLLTSPTQLQSYLGKKSREHREKIRALGGEKSEILTALGLIREISAIVPKATLFDVRELTIIERRIKIKALADSFNAIDTIEKSFKNNPNFAKVTKGDISTAADGKNKNFTLTLDVKKKGSS